MLILLLLLLLLLMMSVVAVFEDNAGVDAVVVGVKYFASSKKDSIVFENVME